jgi:hypothetical protein
VGSSHTQGSYERLPGNLPLVNVALGSTATADRHDATDSNDYVVDGFPAETFPRPTSDGVWLIDDTADYFDRTRNAPNDQKAAWLRNFCPVHHRATRKRHGEVVCVLPAIFGDVSAVLIPHF